PPIGALNKPYSSIFASLAVVPIATRLRYVGCDCVFAQLATPAVLSPCISVSRGLFLLLAWRSRARTKPYIAALASKPNHQRNDKRAAYNYCCLAQLAAPPVLSPPSSVSRFTP